MQLLGISDEITTCDNCGKKNLKCTVALDNEGEVVYFGRDCAGAALYGKKNAKNADKAEMEARTLKLWRAYIAKGKTPQQAADMLCFHKAYTVWFRRGQAMMQTDRGHIEIAA